MDDQILFYTAVAAYGTWATVIAAIVVLIFQSSTAKRLTCLQVFNQLAATYDSEQFNLRRANLASQLIRDPNLTQIDDLLLVFYENLALMIKLRLLDRDLTYNTFGMDVISYWCALEGFVRRTRADCQDDSMYEEFEWLKNYFHGENVRRGIRNLGVNTDRVAVLRFLQMEVLRAPAVVAISQMKPSIAVEGTAEKPRFSVPHRVRRRGAPHFDG